MSRIGLIRGGLATATMGAAGASMGAVAGPAEWNIAGLAARALFNDWILWRIVNGIFSKCSRQCGVLKINDPKRQVCRYQCKIKMYTAAIQGLKIRMAKDPSKSEKIKARIQKFSERIAELQRRLSGAKEEM